MFLLVRHMLGYASHEEHLVSLSLSMLATENAPERCFNILHNLLVDEVGRDYPTSTLKELEALREQAEDPVCQRFYEATIVAIKAPIEQLKALAVIDEIRPPTQLKKNLYLARQKMMDESRAEADEKSILRSIATTVPIKAGKGWFRYQDDGYTVPSYMQSHSTSYTLPLRVVFDTVGSEMRRFNLRYAKKGDVV